MSAGDDLTRRLRETFVQELDEQVRQLNGALLALEKRPQDAEAIRTLFRAAHTVKGAARVANAPLVEQACHALESLFAAVRDEGHALSGAAFSILFAAVDALGEAGKWLRKDTPLDGSALAVVLPRLIQLAGASREGGTRGVDDPKKPVAAPDWPEPGEARSVGRGAASEAGRGSDAAGARELAERPGGEVGAGGVAEEGPAMGRGRRGVDVEPPGSTAGSAEVAEAAGDADEPDISPAPVAEDQGEELVRIRPDRLDGLLAAVGELTLATSRVVSRLPSADEAGRRLTLAAERVTELARGLRLRPIAHAFEALPRAVRDISAEQAKPVELSLVGEQVEADRLVVDTLREPLLHLVRNAVGHGIEDPDARRAAGKSETGRIDVRAEVLGGRLLVTVADDGRGLDEEELLRALRARGRRDPSSRAELVDQLLRGGISTSREATPLSGRGVGLDIVRSALDGIGGAVDVRWRSGEGTTFVLECPPSPTNLRGLVVRVGPHVFGLPTANVERVRRVGDRDIRQAAGRTMLATGDGPIPVRSLAGLLGPPFEARPVASDTTAVLIAAGSRRAALLVDEVVAEQEMVVQPLRGRGGQLRFAIGATVLPQGSIALVLAAGALLGMEAGEVSAELAFAPPPEAPRRRVLVADDSITTRTLEQGVLEAAGFEVLTAVDGLDAWRLLEENGADAIVADIEMPRMDGISLCRRIRSATRFAGIPVVLVTALGSPEDRARGMEAGADAYIVKSAFEHTALIETINQLIGDA